MADDESAPPPPPLNPKTHPRAPSSSQAVLGTPGPSRALSPSLIPRTKTAQNRAIRPQRSSNSLLRYDGTDSLLDALLKEEHNFTTSPDISSRPEQIEDGVRDRSQTPIAPRGMAGQDGRGRFMANADPREWDSSATGSHTGPMGRLGTLSSFDASPPTPVSSPPVRSKPKPSRLNTTDLVIPDILSPTKAISPGLKHWQQVRSHVLAPTPAEEKISQHVGRSGGKKLGIVSKAAGRFGFRQAAEHVMGYSARRSSTMTSAGEFGDLPVEEREEIARERRKFARDIKTCLDACALEESRRRLIRLSAPTGQRIPDPKNVAASVHSSQNTIQRITFDPDFSAYAPLLTMLHRHLPSARAKKMWSRTCPHHAAILAELGVAFIQDSVSTDGERQQALELFGVVVKNWASDSADEELSRWLWLCQALVTDDRQLRTRGLTLLASFLNSDPSLPRGPERPCSTLAFRSLTEALLKLLCATETASHVLDEHSTAVRGFLNDLREGDILDLDLASLSEVLGPFQEIFESQIGLERELSWLSLGHALGCDPALATWLLSFDGRILKVR